jgi:tetratricopeptide (TPR) repeat protein
MSPNNKSQVGSEKNANSNYKKGLEAEMAGKQYFEVAKFRGAVSSFKQARDFYAAAAKDMAINMGRSGADAAKAAMLEARAKVNEDSYAEAKYREAERSRNEGDTDYNAGNFDSAVNKYRAAETLYVAVALESKEKLARESEKLEATKQAIEALIADFERRFERKDYNGIKALFKDFTQYENSLSTFFKVAKDIKVAIDIKNIEPSGNKAKVDIEMKIDFFNTNVGQSEKQTPGTKRWTLEQINNKWAIVTGLW